MNSKHVLLTILITLFIVGIYQFTGNQVHDYPEYKVRIGQIADFDLVAPFDFPLLKPGTQIQKEYQEELFKRGRPYKLNVDAEFDAYRNLDRLFEILYQASVNHDRDDFEASIQRNGFQLEAATAFLLNPELLDSTYSNIRNSLSEIYKTGIYNNINADSIYVDSEAGSRKHNISIYYQLNQAKNIITAKIDPLIANIIRQNSEILVQPNLIVDERRFEEIKKEILAEVSSKAELITQGDVIIKKNQRISAEDIGKLNSLAHDYRNRGEKKTALYQLLVFWGLLVFVYLIIIIVNLNYLLISGRDNFIKSKAIVLNLGFLVLVLLAVGSRSLLGLECSLIPFSMVIISVAILFSIDFAVLYASCSVLLIAPFCGWDIKSLAILLLSICFTLALIKRYRSKYEFLKIWLFQIISLNLFNLAITLSTYSGENLGIILGTTLRFVFYSLITTTISVLGCLVIVNYLERRWNKATKQVLLELQDFNHPLLKKLATNAAGTYHHSLIVGNLAGRAAEAIGADALLTRVGSYYHDVGKGVNPDVYTENNEDSDEIHSRYNPEESAEIIRNHVREGIVLAAKYNIPQSVTDIIIQHHGTSLIRYFLEAAQREGRKLDSDAYRYPGPLPQSKEAALVMLADIVESTTKSKKELNENDILRIIEETIQRLIREGQLDEAPITIKELNLAKMAMLPILEGIYRKRLDYPEDNYT